MKIEQNKNFVQSSGGKTGTFKESDLSVGLTGLQSILRHIVSWLQFYAECIPFGWLHNSLYLHTANTRYLL